MNCITGDMDDEEESAMASANDQRESDFQVIISIITILLDSRYKIHPCIRPIFNTGNI